MSRGRFSARRKPEKLNITSLMDALTIILIFLLVNYSEVTEDNELPKYIKLPTISGKISKSKIGVRLIVGRNKIEVEKGNFINFSSFRREKQRVLKELEQRLSLIKKKAAERDPASLKGNPKNALRLSIHADKAIPYYWINSIVEVSSRMGLNFVDFVAGSVQE